MRIIYTDESIYYFTETILLSVGITVLSFFLVRKTILTALKNDVPCRNWLWLSRILFQILPVILLVAVVLITQTVSDIKVIRYKYNAEQGNYLIAEGKICMISAEKAWGHGEKGIRYICSFSVSDVYFPPSNRYTSEVKDALMEEPIVKIYYFLDENGHPWPWQIAVME